MRNVSFAFVTLRGNTSDGVRVLTFEILVCLFLPLSGGGTRFLFAWNVIVEVTMRRIEENLSIMILPFTRIT